MERAARPGSLGQDDDELVAAEAADEVIAACPFHEAPSPDRAEDLVAVQVPVLVVDQLESVEVDEATAEPVPVASRALHLDPERVGRRRRSSCSR